MSNKAPFHEIWHNCQIENFKYVARQGRKTDGVANILTGDGMSDNEVGILLINSTSRMEDIEHIPDLDRAVEVANRLNSEEDNCTH